MSEAWWDTLPKWAKVGYRTYRIVQYPEPEQSRDRNFAQHDHAKAEIRVALWIDAEKAANSILHEILHAIYYNWDINEKKACEERVVFPMANGLCSVIIDNPDLWAWIQDALKGGQADGNE